ncbi:hypothetical protein Ddye_003170 [Dipteronia dyeriana]|uniref:U-box domain-containing protein n=1 Tax=Dipteronia dyeriana TaxID=168575 RepID=A0AAD9XSD7_9ROSI|nr:hypothetical protein Ddye_003170 [Dipteronia dyeriana]
MFGWRRRNRTGRKTGRSKKQQFKLDKESVLPNHFRCPISLDLMKDPVTLSSGITYDRESIEKWLEDGNFTCPVTNQVLRSFDRIPNHILRKMIQEWCQENQNSGVERIPTPKVPVTGTEVYEILSSIEASMKRLDQCGFLESLKKINKWGFESERNRKCIVDNGTATTLANAFVTFSSDDHHQSLESHNYNVLEEILSSLNWMFPLENDARKILGSKPSLNKLVLLMKRRDFLSTKNAILVVEELCYDQEFIEALVGIEEVQEVLVRFIKEPICHAITKASLMVIFSMVSSSNHDHERIKTQFAEMGLVTLVLNMLIDGEKHLNEIALGVFDRILDSKEGREAACGNDLTMPVLVKKILRVSELATEYSVSSIWKLSRIEKQSNEGRVLFEALQVGAFQKLVLLLQCGCGDSTKEKATQLLKLLNPYRAGLECIESSDFKNLKRSF